MASSNEMVLPTAVTVMAPAAVGAAADAAIKFDNLTTDSFKMGAYVGYGAFGFCRIAKHKETGTICALKAMAKVSKAHYERASERQPSQYQPDLVSTLLRA